MSSLPSNDELIVRLREHTTEKDGCWLWTGADNGTGYGVVNIDGRLFTVHRLSARIHLGLDIWDDKQQANHKIICPNRNCWNPEHLYVGNQLHNVLDSVEEGKHRNQHTNRTHCDRGHEFTEENTIIKSSGNRQCRICKNYWQIANRAYHKR